MSTALFPNSTKDVAVAAIKVVCVTVFVGYTAQNSFALMLNVYVGDRFYVQGVSAVGASLLVCVCIFLALADLKISLALNWRRTLALRASGAKITCFSLAGTAVTLLYIWGTGLRAHANTYSPLFVESPPDGLVLKVLIVGQFCLIAPLFEEAFFRGWMWIAARQKISIVLTILLTSLFWLLGHLVLGLEGVLFLAPVAIWLGLLRAFSGSLIPAAFAHILLNCMTIVPSLWLETLK